MKKQDLNNKKSSKYMEEIHKEDYKALKYFADNTKVDFLKAKQDGNNSINILVKERLSKKGYIDFKDNSQNLYNPKYVITNKGNEYFLQLREIWRKDWTLWISTISIILAIFAFLKSFGVI